MTRCTSVIILVDKLGLGAISNAVDGPVCVGVLLRAFLGTECHVFIDQHFKVLTAITVVRSVSLTAAAALRVTVHANVVLVVELVRSAIINAMFTPFVLHTLLTFGRPRTVTTQAVFVAKLTHLKM